MRELLKMIAEKFTSGNSIDVERITITRSEYLEAIKTPEQFTLICSKCGVDRTKEDCKGERLQCGVMGQAHLTKPEHCLKHGDKVSLTVDDVGQIHVSPEQEPWLWIRKKYDFQGAWISNRLPQDPENWDAVYKAPPRKELVCKKCGEINDK